MNRLLTKKLPAMLLAMAMMVSLVPAASAAKADFSYEVDAGDSIEFSRSDIRDLYEDENSDAFSYLEFTEYDDLDDYGHLEAKDSDGNWTELEASDLDAAKEKTPVTCASNISSASDKLSAKNTCLFLF